MIVKIEDSEKENITQRHRVRREELEQVALRAQGRVAEEIPLLE